MEFIKVKNQIIRIGEIANVSLLWYFAEVRITLKNGKEISVCYKDPNASRINPNKEEQGMAEKGFNEIWEELQKREA